MKLSVREKGLVIFLLVFALLALGINFLIVPQYKVLSGLTNDMLGYKTQQYIASGDLEAVKKIDATQSKVLSETNQAASSLLPTLDNDILNVWFVNMAKSNQLSVVSIMFGQESATNIAVAIVSESNSSKGTVDIQQNYLLKTYADTYRGKSNNAGKESGNLSASANTSSGNKKATPSQANSSGSSNAYPVLGETVDLKVSGSYGNIKNLLNTIANSKRLIRVSSLTCSGSSANCIAEVKIDCYGAEKPDDTDKLFDWQLPAPSGQSSLLK